MLYSDLPGLCLYKRGKVRDIYDLGDLLLIVSTDRISAFDVVLPNGIPDKGRVLSGLSAFWFEMTKDLVGNHLVSEELEGILPEFAEIPDDLMRALKGRSMVVRKAKPLPVECVVRGYLAGSAWREYVGGRKVSGIELPSGLRESERLPSPIFTPSTKAETGHDEPITMEDVERLVGEEIAFKIRDLSISIYEMAERFSLERGIIIADTKMEFGLVGDELILIDELLTPDSSRFWPADEYEPGRPQRSFDKQFVRDYLMGIGWDMNPPAPSLPEDVVRVTSEKYREAYRRITGKDLEDC
jgi:phosphoribosylaminoimidazole-succinocarboxamide synthase